MTGKLQATFNLYWHSNAGSRLITPLSQPIGIRCQQANSFLIRAKLFFNKFNTSASRRLEIQSRTETQI